MCVYCSVAAGAGDYVDNFTALLRGDGFYHNADGPLGQPVIVTYSFPEGDALPTAEEYDAKGAEGYLPMTADDRSAVRLALEEFEAAAGVRFVEIETGGRVQFMRADGASSPAWAQYPSDNRDFGERVAYVVFNDADYDSLAPSSGSFEIVLHEIGHAMGLKHPFDRSPLLEPDLDDRGNTVMSYTPLSERVVTLGPLDVDALRHVYGPPEGLAGVGIDWKAGRGQLVVNGTAEADSILAGNTDNLVRGRGGDDSLAGRVGDDHIVGQAGADGLFGQGGADRLIGGRANDTLEGGVGDDTLLGKRDDDLLVGSDDTRWADTSENDHLAGGRGNDTILGGRGDDLLLGHPGDDRLDGGDGDDVARGYRGRDTLSGGDGDDSLAGSLGADLLESGAGGDTLEGGAGFDSLDGGDGQDVLFGGRGSDTLAGDDGWDTLEGGKGRDVLTGGQGVDVFVFRAGDGRDTIGDLQPFDDIVLEGYDPDAVRERIVERDDHVLIPLDGRDAIRIEGGDLTAEDVGRLLA